MEGLSAGYSLHVRKHRAPKGALRHSRTFFKTFEVASQKAPSAKRCIKTPRHGLSKHQTHQVRKHRAPKGALRLRSPLALPSRRIPGQKAPSAKRCIKTKAERAKNAAERGQKAPSAKRCIKTTRRLSAEGRNGCQKAPSAKRCIKTNDCGERHV